MNGNRIPPALAERLPARFAAEVAGARIHHGALARILTTVAGVEAIVFGRRVFLSREARTKVLSSAPEVTRLLAHELAHVRQYRRSGVAAFLGRYVGEYLGLRLGGAGHAAAYRAISFEREAREEESAAREGAPSQT